MRIGDDGLVQVDFIEMNADARVVIEVAAIDDQVAGSLGDMHGRADVPDQHTRQCRLHDADNANAVGFRVIAFNLDAIYCRHAFVLPFLGAKPAGISGAGMCAFQEQCRSGTGHDDLRHSAQAADRGAAAFLQINQQRLRDAIRPARKLDQTLAIVESVLNRLGVIHHTIACSAEIEHVCHGMSFQWSLRARIDITACYVPPHPVRDRLLPPRGKKEVPPTVPDRVFHLPMATQRDGTSGFSWLSNRSCPQAATREGMQTPLPLACESTAECQFV